MSKLMAHLALVGYRACGKTTLGKRLAELYAVEWVDLDAYIEEQAGRAIPEIFEQQGEEAFRDLETACLRSVCQRSQPVLISTGGGCILREKNRAMLKEYCQSVVYLAAPAAVLSARLSVDAGNRPSLTGASVEEEVAAVLAQREPLYRLAATDVVDANTDLESLVQSFKKIVEN